MGNLTLGKNHSAALIFLHFNRLVTSCHGLWGFKVYCCVFSWSLCYLLCTEARRKPNRPFSWVFQGHVDSILWKLNNSPTAPWVWPHFGKHRNSGCTWNRSQDVSKEETWKSCTMYGQSMTLPWNPRSVGLCSHSPWIETWKSRF